MIIKILLFFIIFLILGLGISVFAFWLVERFGTRGVNLFKGKKLDDKFIRNIPERVNAEELGHIEGTLPLLKQVIIICDHIENPTGSLGRAVEYNFRRNVNYLFLISKSQALDEIDGYYLIYKALERIAASRNKMEIIERNLVEIQQLPYDWNDRPYIFYQMSKPAESHKIMTIAFIGDQIKEGIANNYQIVDPLVAHTIAKTVLAEAPKKIPEALEEEFIRGLPEYMKYKYTESLDPS